jgi:hypothetical protein
MPWREEMPGMRAVAIAGIVAIAVAACSVSQWPQPATPFSAFLQRSVSARTYCPGPPGLDIPQGFYLTYPTPDDIQKGGGWEVCPGKVVMPGMFCRWYERLPPAQQQTCDALHLKPDRTPFTPNWKRFEADNGALYGLDMDHIDLMHFPDGWAADAVICIADNDQCPRQNWRLVRFDCDGHHYMFSTEPGAVMQMAPPRSVIGQILAVACSGAKNH